METSRQKAFLIIITTNGLIGFADLIVFFLLFFQPSVTTFLTSAQTLSFFAPLARTLEHILTQLSAHSYANALFYFASHGTIKLFLAWALLTKKLWAYPLAFVFFGLFSLYQTIALFHSHTVIDALLLVFNIVVLWMVIREYAKVRSLGFV